MANDILCSIAKKSDEHEFYTPVPTGYECGKTKYVIVFGTVMSGIGKGIFSSSLAKLMENKGLKVSPIKFDGYLNVDAGTLNPYRHGEVFVLDDGTECDMDLGTYERMIERNISKDNYLTGGKIFSSILGQERKGHYLGRDVQFIPHVTGEIKKFLRHLALKDESDVIFVEVGGTVGDIENGYFIEAMRQLAYEEGKENVCFVALTYVLEPTFLGEQKSKAAQLGIQNLLSAGVQPDIIACRAHNPVMEKVREKISIYSNVQVKRVISLHDSASIYQIPTMLKQAAIDTEVVDMLGLQSRVNAKMEADELKKWDSFVDKIINPKKKIVVGITGKYTGLRDSYASILKALEHAGAYNNADVDVKWIETTELESKKKRVADELKDVDGIIVPGGFGKRGTEGKIECVKYAREKNIPYLGLCFGFQMAVIDYARNVCGLKDANTTEVEQLTPHPVIDILPEQKHIQSLGGNMRLGGHDVEVKDDTKAFKIYGNRTSVRERFRHRYECNPEYIKVLEEHGLVFSGKAPKQPIMQILELPKHKFFMGTQYHPEFTSRPLNPNPLFVEFVKSCLKP